MSAIAALKGYRTQFLYSLHFILSNNTDDLIFHLEGEEDLDLLNTKGQLLYAIQLKNLGKTITLSDILSKEKTSFIKRFLEKYTEATPMLVSYGEISKELKNWKEDNASISEKEKAKLKKYKITTDDWKLVKTKIQFKEVTEEIIAEEVEQMMKDNFSLIDPIPTIGFLLNWLQLIAEKQLPITTKDFYSKVEDFGKYITERIAIHEQYGLVLKPLHKVSTENVNRQLLEKEFYNATLTRYEHILLGLEINRHKHLEKINEELKSNSTIILKGASGQGKTALLYSYVHNYVNDWLSFELNIQQDPINTQKSIQAIASISKKLDIPTVFVINVNPNTTEWLQILKESVHLNHIKFLVAIRNEDWYRASAVGVEFEHKEIDLTLSKEEAEVIYLKLNERNKITQFADFEEAWIKLGNNAPLLEFVYSITQGDSLGNKLKQQILQILKEGGLTNNYQIEFLRTVCLADSLGAKIDISKLDSNIDYQFIIEKLEDEYLIRKSSDTKNIQGLHLVRSQKLVEILFDEINNRKEEYGYKCISFLAEEDLYLFILQMLYLELFKPDQFISNISKKAVAINWSCYTAILKAFIWAGTKEYVENNRKVIDECRNIAGDAWVLCTDFIFESNYDRNKLFESLNVHEDNRKKIEDINGRLLSNNNVFNLAANFINEISFPNVIPNSKFEWISFGEALFWTKNIENGKEEITWCSESEFESAFKSLDSKGLSKLMLGMYFHSSKLDAIRRKYTKYFIDRIKSEFDIINLSYEGDEINVHYIIDILKNDEKRSTNDFAVNILNIVRTALPDKKRFNSQGYGHRLQTLSMDYDATHKTISVENLPLEEWVNINSCIINLYEYKNRPEGWNEYCIELNKWESLIKDIITKFNQSFNQLFNENKTYSPIVPIMENSLFNQPEKIKAPKSITDPLGVFKAHKIGATSENEREQLNTALQSKHEKFLKNLSDFKGSIENFIKQSAQTVISKIKQKNDEAHIHDEDVERLSQVNLYNSIEKLKEYNQSYKSTLGNVDMNHFSKIDIITLLTTASFWKDFLNNRNKGEHSHKRILKLKSDFEERIIKDCKRASQSNHFSIKYINNGTTDDKPILLIDAENPLWALVGMREAYNIVHLAIDKPEYISLKYLMLELWFSNIYFIQTTYNKSIYNRWNEIKLYIIKDKLFEELSFINSIPKPIDNSILKNLKIEGWAQMHPEFNEIDRTFESYSKLVLLVDHYYDLRFFQDIELNEIDQEELNKYTVKLVLEIQRYFQIVQDSFAVMIEAFPYDESTYHDSEEEQEYFKAIKKINENIFPESKGEEEECQIVITMEVISTWSERLKNCTEGWVIFILLLHGKYINKYRLIY